MKRFSSGGCYADITPKERAIANGQRSFVSFLLLQLSNSFLRIIIIIIVIIIIIIIIIYLLYHSLCWCLFVHQPGAYHVPGASDTQVIHSDHTLSTFLRIRADPSMLIFSVSVTLALSDTLLMFSTIPFFIVPSAPTTTGITSVFICHILCISNSRSLYLLFFSISFRAIFLSDGIDISISLQVEFTESLIMISGLFAVIVLSVLTGMSHMIVILLSLLCVTDSDLCSYHLSITSIS